MIEIWQYGHMVATPDEWSLLRVRLHGAPTFHQETKLVLTNLSEASARTFAAMLNDRSAKRQKKKEAQK